MKLKADIIQRIYGFDVQNDCAIKKELSKILRRNNNSICSYLRENRVNGELTKFEVLQIISDRLAIPIDELVEKE